MILLEGSLLSPNPGLIFWTAITFLILLFVLSKTAWKPIISALDEREKNIQDAINRAEQAKRDAEKILAENKAAFTKAAQEADRMREEAKADAEKVRTSIVEKANAESRKMIEAAKIEINQEKNRAMNDLRDKVAELAIEAAEKIIMYNLDAEKQKNIIAGVINEMKSN